MEIEPDITSFCTVGDLEWHGCYGSDVKYNKYTVPESMVHPAKMSWNLLVRIFKHLESMNLLTTDSVVIDFMAGSGRTGTMAALRRYRTISVELEPHFIEMIAGYDCDGRSISEFKIKPCVCGCEVLHRPHKITTGLCEVECSGNPRIVPACRCGNKPWHKKHHIPGNRELLEQVTGRKVHWEVLKGDARELSKLLDKNGLVGVVSSPYFNAVAFHDKDVILSIAEDKSQRYRDGRLKGHYGSPEANRRYAEKILETYSQDPRNIGNLPDAPLVAIISPPYQDTAMPMGCPAHIRKLAREGDWDKAIELERKAEAEQAKKGNKYAVSTDETIRKKIEMALEREKGNYSENPDNIGNLRDVPMVGIMSPPFLEAQTGGGIAKRGYEGKFYHDQGNPDRVGDRCSYVKALQGTSEGQIGNLPDKQLVGVTSPPYGLGSGGLGNDGRETQVQKDKNIHLHYSESETNIGNEGEESYLSAMLKVYQQAFICGISPLVVVTKNPTRRNALRRLDLSTIDLLLLSGYEIFDYHRAVLFESHKQKSLDGEAKDVHKGRVSFFKRLALEKGATVAQYEDVIFARIP